MVSGRTTGGSTPKPVDKILDEALALHGAGALAEATRLYESVLRIEPKHAFALTLLGMLRSQQGDHAEAIKLIDRALRIDGKQPLALNGKGIALKETKRHDEALKCFGEAIALKPDFTEAYCNRGNTFRDLKRHDEAIADYRKALALAPRFVDAHYNFGLALQDIHRDNEALSCFTRALAINPAYAEAHNASGNSLQTLRRYDEALEMYRKAAALKPDYLDACVNAGDALRELHRYEDALTAYKTALAIHSRTPDVRAPTLLGQYVFTKMALCDWDGLDKAANDLIAGIEGGSVAPGPFALLAVTGEPRILRKCATLYIKDRCPRVPPPLWQGEHYAHDKIRIGYLSADFRAHAVAYLTAGMFEQHDKGRFEIFAFSSTAGDGSEVRKRIEAASDRFVDIARQSDADAARTMRSMEIDILIDLTGLTQGARPEILSYRPAPVQASYLGYPGSTAQTWVDYIVADRIVVPPEQAIHYSEKLAYLPDTYMCGDSKRAISSRTPSRPEAGLPESGFVFCSFNNSYKLSAAMFDVWCRILRAVEGSVLWLPDAGVSVRRNLRREAEARGLSPERLIFAPQLPSNANHLARLRLADLFLDTLPFNAHTTASDALWAGLPVLTCTGTAFPGRVATSLLGAIGLPELVARSLEEYEAMALELASEPERLAGIRSKLATNRETYPLFDTARFTRNIERAYETMWRRQQNGFAPEAFAVEPD